MSMPAMRAMRMPSSALALLVARVLADHHDATVPADHLALLAHLLDAGSDLHDERFSRCDLRLLVPIRDATSGEVVGGELNLHLVPRQRPDVVHPHLPGDVRQDLVAIVQ